MHPKFLRILFLTLGSISLVGARGGGRGGGGRSSGSRSSSSSSSRSGSHQQSVHSASHDSHVDSSHASHANLGSNSHVNWASGSNPSPGSNSHVNSVPAMNPSPGFRAPQPSVLGAPSAPRYPVQYSHPQQVHYGQGAPMTGYPNQYHGGAMPNNVPQRSSSFVPFGAGVITGGIVGNKLGRSHSSYGHYSGSSQYRGGKHSSESNAKSEIDDASGVHCPLDSNSTECAFNATEDGSGSEALKMMNQTSTSSTVQIVDQIFDVNSTNVE